MCDLICDVISCCVWSYDTGKINEYDKIVTENKRKTENMEIKDFYKKNSIWRWFKNGIHSLL